MSQDKIEAQQDSDIVEPEDQESQEVREDGVQAAPEGVVQEQDEELMEDEKLAIDLLQKNPTTIEDVDAIKRAAFKDPNTWERLEHFIKDVMTEDEPDYEQKLAIGLTVLGLYEQSEHLLEELKDIPVIACLLGRIYLETGREEQAVEIFANIHKRVPEVRQYHIFLIHAMDAADDLDGFGRELEILEGEEPEGANTLFFKGRIQERNGEYEEAKNLYQAALDQDPDHQSALFRMAYRLDLEGMDDDAIDYYKHCIESGVSNLAALVNLGILYDDAEEYESAVNCFSLANMIYPQNERARRYLRDAVASTTMYYDEEKEKKEDKQAQILRIPVTDFELSVRSRNCLSKMNIKSLGDLIKKTEAELLAFKNFGETSLQEIKGILSSKNLRLGMITPETDEIPKFLEPIDFGAQTGDTVMNKSLDELDLSVRSKNCLTMLNIKTLGQLAECSEQQLVSCKNFGQTSLNEIRKKLSDFGLSLKV